MNRRHALRHRARHGFTLVELLVVVTLIALLLASIAVALHSLYRADRGLHDRIAQATALSRLGHALRRDAHHAASARIDGEENSLRLETGDDAVEYTFERTRVQRSDYRGGELQHRDSFPLLDATVEWQMSADEKLVTLLVRQQVGKVADADDSYHMHRIRAALSLYAGEQP